MNEHYVSRESFI